MRSLTDQLRNLVAALRMLAVFTVVLGVGYPLVVLGVAQLPGLHGHADGSTIRVGGHVAGSTLIGQNFTDPAGNALPQYFQTRPSDAGDGYDPTASAASNLGPESIVDVLPDPAQKGDTGKPSLLTQVCTRSLAVGRLDGVSGARPFCTATGVGAVLSVAYSAPGYQGHITSVTSLDQACPATPFIPTYQGVRVSCARFGADYARGKIVPVRGDAPAHPAVPADAVTASGSGLDPDISTAYANLQVARVARVRGLASVRVSQLVRKYTTQRFLGFVGEPVVDVVSLNAALDRVSPYVKTR